MKRIFLITCIIVTFLSSCDKIEPPYMIQQINSNDTATNNQQEIIVKKILLEEYTGHTCVHCPKAHKKAKELHQIYGNRLNILAIHAGWFAQPESGGNYTNDFRTSVGNTLHDYFGIVAYPIGMINRIYYNNDNKIDFTNWHSAISSIINDEPPAYIKINNSFNQNTRILNTTINIKFLKQITEQVNLCVFIVEDSIISYQKNADPTIGSTPDIPNYIHMHMLRDAITPAWGDSISTNIPINFAYSKSYTYNLPTHINIKNCYILAFLIYFNNSREVIQSETKKIL